MAESTQQDEFAEIRPYEDGEVAAVLTRLLSNADLLDAVLAFRYPRLPRLARPLARPLLSAMLHRRFGGIGSVDAFQAQLESWFDRLIAGTTAGFSWSGLERLRPGQAYLFVSNHRDIAMDSAFMNYALHAEQLPTSRIAIGDNLLQRPYATDLMRLNKSFVVRRSAQGPREQLAAFMQTSRFLNHSIATGHSVWIAQREGRAKDGCDLTDPAILKMFYVSQRKSGLSFAEVLRNLHIVPVAVSYELDPCDGDKAHELCIKAQTGEYQKPPSADIDSIVTGITGYKGRVHLHFGAPLTEPEETPEAAAAQLDVEIQHGFRLFPTHLEAYRRRRGAIPDWLANAVGPMSAEIAERLEARLHITPEPERAWLLDQYANPVAARLALQDDRDPSDPEQAPTRGVHGGGAG